ncbi:hypothetical protein QJQ45_005762 [Haematococcus lacustris]|nr:hypothetical protein QJQ45_005762 [Haematococcus lacustris]
MRASYVGDAEQLVYKQAATQCRSSTQSQEDAQPRRTVPRRSCRRPGRVVLVDDFRTSRVSSADNTPSKTLPDTPSESFRFYDRDMSAALNTGHLAVGSGPRPTELCYWTNRPAMPKPGQPGQGWTEIADKAMLRKWRRKLQR